MAISRKFKSYGDMYPAILPAIEGKLSRLLKSDSLQSMARMAVIDLRNAGLVGPQYSRLFDVLGFLSDSSPDFLTTERFDRALRDIPSGELPEKVFNTAEFRAKLTLLQKSFETARHLLLKVLQKMVSDYRSWETYAQDQNSKTFAKSFNISGKRFRLYVRGRIMPSKRFITEYSYELLN